MVEHATCFIEGQSTHNINGGVQFSAPELTTESNPELPLVCGQFGGILEVVINLIGLGMLRNLDGGVPN